MRRSSYALTAKGRAFRCFCRSTAGFSLLEVIVALAILGIAITVIMQLFSANLKAIAVSDQYVDAVVMAEAKMREVLDLEKLEEKSWREQPEGDYAYDITVGEIEKERTETLPVRLFEITVTAQWSRGDRQRTQTLKTLKLVRREIS